MTTMIMSVFLTLPGYIFVNLLESVVALSVGLMGTFRTLIQKSMGIVSPF